jgi:hypothetical protein
MAKTIHIKKRKIRDTLRLRINITDLTSDDPVVKLWFTVKVAATDDDADALLQKVQTSGFTYDDDGMHCVLPLLHTETALFTPDQPYVYDIQVLTAAGDRDTPIDGTITLEQDTTHATS